jgi:REP element-mobilizing transposase RayT
MRFSRQMSLGKSAYKYPHKREKSEHGGSLKNPQKRKRPIGVKSSMHLVLRSSLATGDWSFRKHHKPIENILQKFSKKHAVHILDWANVGNHLHLHMRVYDRRGYRNFIRAITSAIMIAVTQFSRWRKAPLDFQFWDARPFSRILSSWREILNLRDYVKINKLQGLGWPKSFARIEVKTLQKMNSG